MLNLFKVVGSISLIVSGSYAFADTQPPDTPLPPEGQVYSRSALEIFWQRSSDDIGVAEYVVYRNDLAVFTADALSYFDDSVISGQSYAYRVRAVDAAGNESVKSDPLVLVVGSEPVVSDPVNDDPFQPTGLTGAVVAGEARLQWQAPVVSREISGYNIYRNDQYFDTVARTTYNDPVDDEETVNYYVVAFDSTPEYSVRSHSLQLTGGSTTDTPTEPDTSVEPGRPEGLSAGVVTATSVELTWTAHPGFTGYNVYRDGAYLTTVFDTEFVDSGLESSISHQYAITGFDGAGFYSTASDPVTVSTAVSDNSPPATPQTADPSVPGTPVLDLTSDNRLVVAWEPSVSSRRITGYNVFRNGEYYTTVFEPVFSDQSVSADTEYTYYVVGYNEDVMFSDASATATFKTGFAAGVPADVAQPTAPQNLTELLIGNDWVELRWEPASDDQGIIAYQIHRDGELLYTVPTLADIPEDQRYASTNSYVDCNRTRAYERCLLDQPDVGTTHTYTVYAVDTEFQLSPPSNTLTVRLNSNVGPVPTGVLDDFELVFAEEFDGELLDAARWNTRLPWGPYTTINGEQQFYVDIQNIPDFGYNPFELTGNTLRISGVPTPDALSGAANFQPFMSGAITSRDRFNMTYGYVEGRIKLAAPVGSLSSFYLFHTWPVLNSPEIDIVEYIGQTPDVAYQTYHYEDEQYGEVPHPTPTMLEQLESGNWSDDFHIYSVLWEPNLVIWYIDGAEVKRIEGPQVSRQSMYIIAYLVLGSEWALTPDLDAPIFPVSYEIDYIRAYQRPEFIRR